MHLTCCLHGVRPGLPRLRCGAGVRSRQSGIAHGSAFRQYAVTRHSPRRQSLAAGRVKLPCLSGLVSLTPPLRSAFSPPQLSPLRSGNDLAYNPRRPFETKDPPAHRAGLVCGLVDAPGCRDGVSEGLYFISIPTSLGLRTTSFWSIFAMWSFAAVPSP